MEETRKYMPELAFVLNEYPMDWPNLEPGSAWWEVCLTVTRLTVQPRCYGKIIRNRRGLTGFRFGGIHILYVKTRSAHKRKWEESHCWFK
jgi:hypothetical protein